MIDAVYVYRGFEYRDPFVLLFDHVPLIEFESYELLTNFVDEALNMIEQAPIFKDFKLHLTGCKRCSRTADAIAFSPCETGKSKFIGAKNATSHICKALVEGINAEKSNDAAAQQV